MRTLTLCSQPQPPANCQDLIQSASDDLNVANQTLAASRNQLAIDERAQSAASLQLNQTQQAFAAAVSKKTADIAHCNDVISQKSDEKNDAAEALDEATQQCPGACPPPPPTGRSHYVL